MAELPAPWLALAAVALESAAGYPGWLHRRLPHPVVWLGRAIDGLERRWNRANRGEGVRRGLGVLAMLLVGAAAALAGLAVERLLGGLAWGAAAIALVATLGVAQRSLFDHVRAVLRPLADGDLPAARRAVGLIVGRDTGALTPGEVAGAALESLAESFNDGVVAPVFWFVVAGLPGLFLYKAANTADSLIGHREPRWRAFGWAAARTDDILNLVPARLAGALLALAGGPGSGGGWAVMLREAGRHASPNAGWPEAAMAGALGVRLGGPARYDGVLHDRPVFGGGPLPGAADLRRGLRLYVIACALMWGLLALGGLAWPR
jgi:adenosylcobinamide-phosphate synthase